MKLVKFPEIMISFELIPVKPKSETQFHDVIPLRKVIRNTIKL